MERELHSEGYSVTHRIPRNVQRIRLGGHVAGKMPHSTVGCSRGTRCLSPLPACGTYAGRRIPNERLCPAECRLSLAWWSPRLWLNPSDKGDWGEFLASTADLSREQWGPQGTGVLKQGRVFRRCRAVTSCEKYPQIHQKPSSHPLLGRHFPSSDLIKVTSKTALQNLKKIYLVSPTAAYAFCFPYLNQHIR